jgi:hypothetical protein
VPPAVMLLIIIFCEEADVDLSLGGVLEGIDWLDIMDALQPQDVCEEKLLQHMTAHRIIR